MENVFSLAGLLLLGACVTVGRPIGYTRQAPEAVYPAGELSGPPSYFIGWKQPFHVDEGGVLRWGSPKRGGGQAK